MYVSVGFDLRDIINVLCCFAQRCAALRCVALRCVALRCVALRCVTPRCVALHVRVCVRACMCARECSCDVCVFAYANACYMMQVIFCL